MPRNYKKRITEKSIIIFLCLAITSCTCGSPLQVTPIQRSDKNLDCGQIILEITEAEQYRDYAMQQRGISMGEALMPICWATGFVDGGKAASRANERVEYLGRLYETRGCVNEGRSFFQRKSEPQNPDGLGDENAQQSYGQNQSYAPNNSSQSNYGQQPNYNMQQNSMGQGRGQQSFQPQPNYTNKPNYYNSNYSRQQNSMGQMRQPSLNSQPQLQGYSPAQNPNMRGGYYKPKNEFGDKEMHEHKNKQGDPYTHFHTHNQPHTHSSDQ